MVNKTIRKRTSKGCFDYKTKKYRLENIVFKSCIGNYTIDLSYYINLYSLYEKGIMPFNGLLKDQPAKIIEIFSIIEQKKLEYTKEKVN